MKRYDFSHVKKVKSNDLSHFTCHEYFSIIFFEEKSIKNIKDLGGTNKMTVLTDKQYLLLSQFAYVKATINPNDFKDYVYFGWTLKDIIGEVGVECEDTILGNPEGKIIENNGSMTTEYVTEKVLKEIAADETLGSLKLKDYQNDESIGFSTYTFEDDSGNSYLTFT